VALSAVPELAVPKLVLDEGTNRTEVAVRGGYWLTCFISHAMNKHIRCKKTAYRHSLHPDRTVYCIPSAEPALSGADEES
jgi:hypothetical protein